MSIKKPSTFPIKQILDGSEEIYTQTNGVSEKFTVATVATYVTQFADEWLYKEIFVDSAEATDMFSNPIIILEESDLASNEYFEINRVIMESKFNGASMTCNFDTYISYKATRYAPLNTSEYYYQVPKDFIETQYDTVLCFYSSYTASAFRRNHGVYMSIDGGNMGEGNTDYTIKIYYKIVS